MQILFVYNADSDSFSATKDFWHKILRPSTYPCKLCSITYGNLNMKSEWADFIDSLPVSVEFLHKDNFLKRYKERPEFPCTFVRKGKNLKLLITADEINKCTSLKELMALVKRKAKRIS